MTGVERLATMLRGRRVAVLTGAGCSTESGIPDYRGPETRKRARNPVRYRQFTESDQMRARYWSRAMVGWHRFHDVLPNPAHHALVALERHGAIEGVITQNVDRLHRRAGSNRLVELHGALEEVVCLECKAVVSRLEVQQRLETDNPGFAVRTADDHELAPDGDAEVDVDLSRFVVPGCECCGGVLKPNVVFFGESVPPPVRQAADVMFEAADALLVVGSSLAVYSGYRFVHAAARRGLLVGCINLGPLERGGDVVAAHVDARAGQALPELAGALGCGGLAAALMMAASVQVTRDPRGQNHRHRS